MKLSRLGIVAGLVGVCCVSPGEAFAQRARGVQFELQTHCPVHTDKLVSPKSRWMRYRRVKVYFSSATAMLKFNRAPEAYLDKKILPQLKEMRLPERRTDQVFCPVFTKRKISPRDLFVFHEGQRVYFFNQDAKERFLLAPERFIDFEVLPQLKPPEPAEKSEGNDGQPAGDAAATTTGN